MDFIWIVAGVIYILYMLFSDKPKTTISILLGLSPVIILAVIAIILNCLGFESIAKVITPIGMLIGLPIVYWWSKQPNDPEKVTADRKAMFDKWAKFIRTEYPDIRNEDINLLIDSPNSPLNSEKIRITQLELYTWLCNHHSWRMNSLSDEELGRKIGIPFDELPLDEKLNSYHSKQKLRALVINTVLKEQYGGLKYKDSSYKECAYVVVEDEYSTKLNNFIKNYNSEHH